MELTVTAWTPNRWRLVRLLARRVVDGVTIDSVVIVPGRLRDGSA